ncbi:conserved hypothetical protein [Vibrio crassostreae]|nr:conserved hypothetical protein [Vibrio crassostreae]CAK2030541.1 conserved hypothetical protein [Vibrio crassostreae]CAK2041163.1 conserved hypothetical protein [Vibrio crassostreae]CAK2894992.1 conserved hypothetical protein [Vibrio crassostreae]CAK2899089.1 conserved hypothetical protein [Vibrio crassostreae]
MDGAIINALVSLTGEVNPALTLCSIYLLLKVTRTQQEHDKRISKLEWENDNG